MSNTVKSLAKTIIKLAEIDQMARHQLTDDKQANIVVYLVDHAHRLKIKDIIKTHGYPTSTTIGKRAMEKFWLLIQHQDFDLELQKACLEHCDFSSKNKAYLTDRVRINEGKKQIYGTQFYRKKDGSMAHRPIQDPKNVDARRKKVGLQSLEEYKKVMRKMSKSQKKG